MTGNAVGDDDDAKDQEGMGHITIPVVICVNPDLGYENKAERKRKCYYRMSSSLYGECPFEKGKNVSMCNSDLEVPLSFQAT